MMKKSLTFLLMVGLFISLSFSALALPYEGTTIRVLVWRDALTEAIKRMVPEFEELTGMKVIIDDLPTGELTETAALNLAAKTGHYDMVAIDEPFMPRFSRYLLVYDEWPDPLVMEEKTPLEDLVEAAVYGGRWLGDVYGIPVNANVYMFLYRKDLFEDTNNKRAFLGEYGYELAPPETTQQLLDIARFFYDPPRTYGYAPFTLPSEGTTVEAMWLFNTFGTRILDENLKLVLDRDRAIEAINFYRELMETSPPGKENFGHPETIMNIETGRVVMALQWPAIIAGHETKADSLVAGKLGYKAPPAGPYGNAAAVTGTWTLNIVKDTPNVQAAAEFGYWWTNEEVGRRLIEAGMSPVRIDLLSDPSLQAKYTWYSGQLDSFLVGVNRPRYPGYMEISHVVTTQFTRAVTGEVTPEVAVDRIIEQVGNLLN